MHGFAGLKKRIMELWSERLLFRRSTYRCFSWAPASSAAAPAASTRLRPRSPSNSGEHFEFPPSEIHKLLACRNFDVGANFRRSSGARFKYSNIGSHFVTGCFSLVISAAMVVIPFLVDGLAPDSTQDEWHSVFGIVAGILVRRHTRRLPYPPSAHHEASSNALL